MGRDAFENFTARIPDGGLLPRKFEEKHQEHRGQQQNRRDLQEEDYGILWRCATIVPAFAHGACFSAPFDTFAHKKARRGLDRSAPAGTGEANLYAVVHLSHHRRHRPFGIG